MGLLQLIKQSQVILNFLAIEGRITSDHIDVIWAAGQVYFSAFTFYNVILG